MQMIDECVFLTKDEGDEAHECWLQLATEEGDFFCYNFLFINSKEQDLLAF